MTTLVAAGLGVTYVRSPSSQVADRSHVALAPPDTMPPPVPQAGARDSLIALVAAPPGLLDRFETRETDYESKALAVFGHERRYFLVGLPGGGRAWIHERETGAAHPIEQLLINRLNYLTPSWDMTVRESPGRNIPPRSVELGSSTQTAEIPARVLQFTRQPDGTWMQVEVYRTSPCGGGTPRVVATGWIPLYGADASPTVWFHSRGC